MVDVVDEKMVTCDVVQRFRWAFGATADAQIKVDLGEQELPEAAAKWAADNGYLAEKAAPKKKAK